MAAAHRVNADRRKRFCVMAIIAQAILAGKPLGE